MSKINITIPVYNEEAVLEENILKLVDFCAKNIKDEWFIVIANNNSTDATSKIGKKLVDQNTKRIKLVNIAQKGKGLAVKNGWDTFSADYYIFMDADLATNLTALPLLIKELKNGNDVVIGSRTLPQSKAERTKIRQIISLFYITLARFLLNLKLTDLACGFKGINAKIKEYIIPQIKNTEWFFDTEMLYLANKNYATIKEIPIHWIETPNLKRKSSVNFISVGLKYLRAILETRIAGR